MGGGCLLVDSLSGPLPPREGAYHQTSAGGRVVRTFGCRLGWTAQTPHKGHPVGWFVRWSRGRSRNRLFRSLTGHSNRRLRTGGGEEAVELDSHLRGLLFGPATPIKQFYRRIAIDRTPLIYTPIQNSFHKALKTPVVPLFCSRVRALGKGKLWPILDLHFRITVTAFGA